MRPRTRQNQIVTEVVARTNAIDDFEVPRDRVSMREF